jgi:predicted nucleic acid-binding protein
MGSARKEKACIKKYMAKKVKVFLDSNVLLSGLLSEKGAPRIILDLLTIKLPSICGATGRYNLMEIERNLEKKMSAIIPVYLKYMPLLDLEIVSLPSWETIRGMSKQAADKDIPVLASAICCNADYLVTGDKKDFAKPKDSGNYQFKIVSPAEFLERVLQDMLH